MQVILLRALSHFRADPQHVDPRLPFRPRLAQRLTQYLEHFNGNLTRMFIFPRGVKNMLSVEVNQLDGIISQFYILRAPVLSVTT